MLAMDFCADEVHELMMSQRRNLRGPDVWGQNMTVDHPTKRNIDGADPSWWFFMIFHDDFSPFGFELLWEWCHMLWIHMNSRIWREHTVTCTPSEALCRQFVNSRWFVRSPVAGFITMIRVLLVESCASTCFTRCFFKRFQVFGSIRFNMFQHVSTCFDMFRHWPGPVHFLIFLGELIILLRCDVWGWLSERPKDFSARNARATPPGDPVCDFLVVYVG